MEIKDPAFGNEMDFDEAMETLSQWQKAGSSHGLMYGIVGEGSITTSVKIKHLEKGFMVCTGDKLQLVIKLTGANFKFGPIALMEYPIKQESTVKGFHIDLKTGNHIFISSQSQLPNNDAGTLVGPNLSIDHSE